MTLIFADSKRHADESQHPLKKQGDCGYAALNQVQDDDSVPQ